MANGRRGRPKGSGIDDTPILEAVAVLIDNDPKLRVATAIKIVDLEWTASSLRRLEKKWSRDRAMLMEKIRLARADRSAAESTPARSSQARFGAATSVADRIAQACSGFEGVTRAGRMLDELPGIRAARERQERYARLASLTEPRLALTRKLEAFPGARLAHAFESSALHRVMEQHKRVMAAFGF